MAHKKHSKPVGKEFVAQLELPDSPPPLKSGKDQKAVKAVKAEHEKAFQQTEDRVPVQPVQENTVTADGDAMPEHSPQLSPSKRLTSLTHPFGVALFKEKERRRIEREDGIESDSVPLKLMAQLGSILMRPDHETLKKLAHAVRDPADLQTSFRKYSHSVRTDFLNRLTTTTADAQSLLRLGAGSPSEWETNTRYELLVRDASGTMLKVTVEAPNKSAYSIKKKDQYVGEALSHFPMHVWDARFLLVERGVEIGTTSTQAIKDLILSMESDQPAPSFRANAPLSLRLEAVQAKRTFSHDVDGVRFFVTQVQNLSQEILNDPRHNLRAAVRNEEDMISEQRMWWEAGWETFDLEKADLLQAKVNGMVVRLDAIGLDNKGPFERQPDYTEVGEDPEEPEIPFW